MNRQQFGRLQRAYENSFSNDPQKDPLYDENDYCPRCDRLIPCDCEEEDDDD